MAQSQITSKENLMAYRIGRGEQGVLTYQPYKSLLLPHWRFKTPDIAHSSSAILYKKFQKFYVEGDFVGMDMARKFLQMGMTRAKRYASYKGGRKYIGGKASGKQMEKSERHQGKEEKEEASNIFKAMWQKCMKHEGYEELKQVFLMEQKQWNLMAKSGPKGDDKGMKKKINSLDD